MKKTKVGRPEIYTKELGEKICDAISSGSVLAEICEDQNMPSARTVYRWRRNHDDFCQNYARAREDRSDELFDKMEEIERQVLEGEIHPNQGRVTIDSIKWRLGKMNSKYSDNKHYIDVTANHSEDLEAKLNCALKHSGALTVLSESQKLIEEE